MKPRERCLNTFKRPPARGEFTHRSNVWLVKGDARARGGGGGRGGGDHNQRAERREKREMRYLQLNRVFRGPFTFLKDIALPLLSSSSEFFKERQPF